MRNGWIFIIICGLGLHSQHTFMSKNHVKEDFAKWMPLKKSLNRVLEANSNYSVEWPLTVRELILTKIIYFSNFSLQSSLTKTVGVDQIQCESIMYLSFNCADQLF